MKIIGDTWVKRKYNDDNFDNILPLYYEIYDAHNNSLYKGNPDGYSSMEKAYLEGSMAFVTYVEEELKKETPKRIHMEIYYLDHEYNDEAFLVRSLEFWPPCNVIYGADFIYDNGDDRIAAKIVNGNIVSDPNIVAEAKLRKIVSESIRNILGI